MQLTALPNTSLDFQILNNLEGPIGKFIVAAWDGATRYIKGVTDSWREAKKLCRLVGHESSPACYWLTTAGIFIVRNALGETF